MDNKYIYNGLLKTESLQGTFSNQFDQNANGA